MEIIKKSYNVISKKEFIIYFIFCLVYTIASIVLISMDLPKTPEDIKNTVLFMSFPFFIPLSALTLNLVFNIFKLEDNALKLSFKIIFNIFTILYSILLVLYMYFCFVLTLDYVQYVKIMEV